MDTRSYVEKIIASDNQEKKNKLMNTICDMMDELDEECKKDYEVEIYEI